MSISIMHHACCLGRLALRSYRTRTFMSFYTRFVHVLVCLDVQWQRGWIITFDIILILNPRQRHCHCRAPITPASAALCTHLTFVLSLSANERCT